MLSCSCVHSFPCHSARTSRRQVCVTSQNQRAVSCRAAGTVNKRHALLGSLAIIAIEWPQAAEAWDGPAKFLKGRQQANIGKLTAPLTVSMKRLQDASRLTGDAQDYSAALQVVRAASCNCYKFESFSTDSLDSKVSMMTQNMGLADPCTFRIIVKNVTVLMDDDDALKLETKEVLAQVVTAFEVLDDVLISADEFQSETRDKVDPALTRLIQLELRLKEQIKQCIMQEA